MHARSFVGWNGKWLDVTPLMRVDAEQLDANDERAWQRDITRFLKKAEGNVRNHTLRETAIIRILVEAGDRYYHILLCSGQKKKVLCPSPIFCLLSASTSPGSIRGASPCTLPLEIGPKILASTAKFSIGNAISPVTSTLQQQVKSYEPPWTTRRAANIAYDVSGLENRVDSNIAEADLLCDQKRDAGFAKLVGEDKSFDEGPKPPFPINFIGAVESFHVNYFDMPVIPLASVPEDLSHRLNGYYFGWGRPHTISISSKPPTIETNKPTAYSTPLPTT